MKCPSCKGEFTPPANQSIANCPFCGEPLIKPAVTKKCGSLAEAFAFVKENFGEDLLLHGQRLTAMLADLMPQAKRERAILKNAFIMDIPRKLDGAKGKDTNDRMMLMSRAVQILETQHGIAGSVSEGVLWSLAEAMGWEARAQSSEGRTQSSELRTQKGEPAPEKRPVGTVAPERPKTSAPVQQSMSVEASVKVGDIIPFGGYDWRVLDVRDGKALLITKEILETRPYNVGRKKITWEKCTLRQYLNGAFYDSLGEAKHAIAETHNSNPNNQWYGTKGGNATNDKVFLLSLDEVCRYFGDSTEKLRNVREDEDYLSDKNSPNRIARQRNIGACQWWLRSPGGYSSNIMDAAVVYDDGDVGISGVPVNDDDYGGVRPALWLDLSAALEKPRQSVRETAPERPRPVTTSAGAGQGIDPRNGTGNISNGGHLCIQGDWIYSSVWMATYKIPAGLNADHVEDPEAGIGEVASYINIIGDYMYYSSFYDKKRLYRKHLGEKTTEKLNEQPSYHVTVSGEWVYYKNKAQKGSLYKIRTDGKYRTRLLENTSGLSIAVAGDWVYAGGEKIRTDGTGHTKWYQGEVDDSFEFNISDGWIYYIQGRDGLYKVHIEGGESTTVISGPVYLFNVCGEWIYYTYKKRHDCIYKIRIDGTDEDVLCKTDETTSLNVVGDWVYFMDGSANLPSRVSTDGDRCEQYYQGEFTG